MKPHLIRVKPQKVFDGLVYAAFIGYIAFLPSGPYPIPVFGNRLDVIFGIILVLLLLPAVPRFFREYPPLVTVSILCYLFTTLLSASFSIDQAFSVMRWFITLGYVSVTVLAPLTVFSKIAGARRILLVIAGIVGSIIVSMYIYFAYGSSARIALPITQPNDLNLDYERVDPNMTAIGLLMTILFYLPNLDRNKSGRLGAVIETLLFAIILVAATTTLSRTAMVSFAVAFMSAALLLLLRGMVIDRDKYVRNSIIMVSILVVAAVSTMWIVTSAGVNLIQPFSVVGDESAEIRIELAESAIEVAAMDTKHAILGQGYFTTNPHNELLRHLSSAGVVGLSSFVALLLVVYLCLVEKIRAGYFASFSARALYLYVVLMMQTYGHTKSMWAGLMFIMVLYLETKGGRAAGNRISAN